jgi:CrcB protein
MNALWVAIGGALGAVGRYAVSLWVTPLTSGSWPMATLLVNVAGSLGIGVVFVLLERGLLHGDLRYFLVIGVFGGFTTFSTFSLELLQIVEQGDWSVALQYAFASCVSCFLGVGLGAAIARQSLSSL